jgi:hypothetical protein
VVHPPFDYFGDINSFTRNEAIKHNISNRIDEFEDILIEGFGWK